MSLIGPSYLYTRSQPKHTDPLFNLMKEVTFFESSDTDCEQEQDLPSFDLYANDPLVSWLLLLASSSIFHSKNVNFSPMADPNTSRKVLKFGNAENLDAIDSPRRFSGDSGPSSSEVSDFEKATYWDSLFDLEGEDSDWISDFEFSSPLSTKSDSSSELSDSDRATYLYSLLSLEDEDSEWLSDSKPELDLLETQAILDEPLFWPFQEKFNWNFEESWSSFSTSPRKHTDKSSQRKQSSSEIATFKNRELKDDELKTRVVRSLEPLSIGKNFPEEILVSDKQVPTQKGYFALGQQLSIEILVGLEEFDGHEGLDSEYYGNVFVLDE